MREVWITTVSYDVFILQIVIPKWTEKKFYNKTQKENIYRMIGVVIIVVGTNNFKTLQNESYTQKKNRTKIFFEAKNTVMLQST